MVLVWLIVMIVLGLISAALAFYNKNYFVRVFDDIIGREEEDTVAVKMGRSFVYGFLFPVYFFLLLCGAVILLICLIVGAIVAGIVFVLVWITEKIIPHEGLGKLIESLFTRVGLPGFPPSPGAGSVSETVSTPKAEVPRPPAPSASPRPPGDEQESPFPGGGINRTRVHTLD